MANKAAYSVLSDGFYAFNYAEVLGRRAGSTDPFFQFGDVDAFSLNIATTKVERYRKNAAVRTLGKSAVTQIDATVSMTCFQFVDFVRLASVCGVQVPFVQAQAANVAQTLKAKVGIHKLSRLNVSNLALTGFTNDNFRLVDEALGMVEILSLPGGVAADADVATTFACAAIAAGAQDRISIAAQPEINVELMVRKVSDIGPKEVIHLFNVALAPNGDQAFIASGDEFASVQLTGKAAGTNDGVGYRQLLAA